MKGAVAQGGDGNLNRYDTSQKAYDQVADELFACIEEWNDAGICSLFALSASLDLIAEELRELLPDSDAEDVIQGIIQLHKGDV